MSDSTLQTSVVGRGLVADQRLRRPVVRVRVALAGPPGGGRPRRPAEEGGELPDLRGSVMAPGRRPFSVVGSEKKLLVVLAAAGRTRRPERR